MTSKITYIEIKAPYQTYTGKVLNEQQCEAYNVVQRRMNRFVEAGLEVPEELKNGSFHLFRTLCEC